LQKHREIFFHLHKKTHFQLITQFRLKAIPVLQLENSININPETDLWNLELGLKYANL